MKNRKLITSPAPTLSAEAVALRQRLIHEYHIEDQAGLLLLQTACEAFTRMRQAQALIAQHGVLVKDRFGQLQKNPALTLERDGRAAMLAALRALNLDLEPLAPTAGRQSRSLGVTTTHANET